MYIYYVIFIFVKLEAKAKRFSKMAASSALASGRCSRQLGQRQTQGSRMLMCDLTGQVLNRPANHSITRGHVTPQQEPHASSLTIDFIVPNEFEVVGNTAKCFVFWEDLPVSGGLSVHRMADKVRRKFPIFQEVAETHNRRWRSVVSPFTFQPE